MATNKIYFNDLTTPVTLKGVYYNGTKIEGCKGIKLNGTVVVSFDTVSHQLQWSDYTDMYNAVWTSTDTTVETNKMAKMTAENEFVICRSAWTLYTRTRLLDELGFSDTRLFNFNSDGRLYIGDDTIIQNWQTLLEQYTEPITIYSTRLSLLKNMLTGLPLIYKTEDASFAATKILDDNVDFIRYDSGSGEWIIGLRDLSIIKDPNGTELTENDIAQAISNTIGVTATASDGSITVAGAANWGEFEFLDALSNVYIPRFGPFYDPETTEADEFRRLVPNEHFLAQSYWGVNITLEIRIKYASTPCDLYILTGYGLQYVLDNAGITVGDYSVQGEDNAKVNITYFDTSCFAGLQYPNILCKLNSYYSNFRPDYIFTSGNWAGIDMSDHGSNAALAFPTDCPYEIDQLELSDLTLELPNATTGWIAENNLENTKVTCVLNQTLEVDYLDDSDILPDDIAQNVFNEYQQEADESGAFPYNNPALPDKTVEYVLKLKMRTYPCYADGTGTTGATTAKWYLNAYDPYNVGGYYPVKKTTTAAAGSKFNTTVNYTAQ